MLAREDEHPQVRLIAENRLAELKNRRVYGCGASTLYHRDSCPARHGAILPITWFDYWGDAEAAGRVPCPQCKPQRLFSDLIVR